jgi:hypothetical protein
MMSKKLYALTLILSSFFTNVLVCMTDNSIGSEVVFIKISDTGDEKKEVQEIEEKTEEKTTSLSPDIAIAIRQAMLTFYVGPEFLKFRYSPTNNDFIHIDVAQKFIELNEKYAQHYDLVTWAAYYIAACIHAPENSSLASHVNSACKRLLHHGRHDVLLNRMGTLVAKIISGDSTPSCMIEMSTIKTQLDAIGYSSNFTLSYRDKNSCVLTSQVSERSSSFSITNRCIIKLANPYSTYKQSFDDLMKPVTTTQPGCQCIIL